MKNNELTNRGFRFISSIITCIILFSSAVNSVSADILNDSNKLFDWAEFKYPQLFSSAKDETQQIENYLVRYYPATNSYIGTKGTDVYVYGDVFGGLIQLGKIGDYVDLENPYISREKVEDSTTVSASKLNANNIMAEAKNVDAKTYVDFFKRIKELKIFGVPDFRSSLNFQQKSNRTSIQKNAMAKNRRNKDYDCLVSGRAYENINIIQRGGLEADTYKAGDDYRITYYDCNMGHITYNGIKRHTVGNFSEFDLSKVGDGDPMGAFYSEFDDYSIETSTQKITLDGTFIYAAESVYPAVRDAAPTSLQKTFKAEEVTITFLNKETNIETVLTYDGILEHITFTKKLLTQNEFTYCKYVEYDLTINESDDSNAVPIYEKLCGDVEPGFTRLNLLPPKPIDQSKGSSIQINGGRILAYLLADGRTRYFYEETIDSSLAITAPDAITDSGETTIKPPQTDDNLDLMNGVVIFAYEGCPHYENLFNYLDENNVSYTYIDIDNTTTANKEAFDWFESPGVPFVGINGHFFGNNYNMFILEGLVQPEK